MTLPEFPLNPKVDDFRVWLRDFSKHCVGNGHYPSADVVFEAVRKTEHPVDHQEAANAMLLDANSTCTEDHPQGPDCVINHQWTDDQRKGLYDAIEHSTKGKCESVLSHVKRGEGYEAMRTLCRHYDARNPDLRQLMQSELFGLSNRKCADFAAVSARMTFIDKIVNEMHSQCGESPSDATLADVFAPSLDASTVYQIAMYRNDRGEVVNKKSYKSLQEYVRNRQGMERSLMPIKPRKMEISGVEAPSYAAVAQSPAPLWSPSDDANLHPSP